MLNFTLACFSPFGYVLPRLALSRRCHSFDRLVVVLMFIVALFYPLVFVSPWFIQSPVFFVQATPGSRHLSHRHTHSMARRGSPGQINAFLDAHNSVRALHNAAPLTWSPSLAAKAEIWADQCQFRHTNGVLNEERYGENIAAGTGFFPISAAVNTFINDQGMQGR